jgi:tripartite-type tricarboxylate transporter receptor subunit TctC
MRLLKHALVLLCMVPAGAAAQADYPSRPIRIVVPFAAGGGNDILAREMASKLQANWGQPVLVENKPGAGGNIGADFVARAPADGHTLLLATNTVTINPHVQKNVPFDARRDFAPIALLASTPFVLVVNPDLPVQSVAQLVDFARANPNRLSYASVGIGTPHHLGMELFKSLTGTAMVHVPYKGSVPALSDTATGQTQLMMATINAARPFMQGNRLRALGVGERQRLASMKDLPTIAEAGVPGFELTAWYAILAPAATPADVQRKLSEALLAAIREPDTRERLLPAGFEIMPGTPAELRSLIATDFEQWARVVRNAGIKPE